jgi:hypothetical protein
MPDTTNFGWTMPTPGGDTGIWDTILNTMFQDIDDDVAALQARSDAQHERMLIPAVSGNGLGWIGSAVNGAMFHDSGAGSLIVPLPHLRPGMRVTGLHVRGVDADTTSVAVLAYQDDAGANTDVGSGVGLPAALGNVSETSLTHDIAADRMYYVYITPNPGEALAVWVALDIEDSP